MITTWTFSETIRRSYTHIIPRVCKPHVFDEMLSTGNLDCADDITKYYDDSVTTSMYYSLPGEGEYTVTLRRLLLINMTQEESLVGT